MRRIMIFRLYTIAAACLLSWFLAASCFAEGGGTRILGVRTGEHPDHTRIVFDAEGARPVQVGEPGESRVIIRFSGLEAQGTVNRSFGGKSRIVDKIELDNQGGAASIVISLRERKARLKQMVIPGEGSSSGAYRLVLDFYPGDDSDEPRQESTADSGKAEKQEEASTATPETASATPSRREKASEVAPAVPPADSKGDRRSRRAAEKEAAEKEKAAREKLELAEKALAKDKEKVARETESKAKQADEKSSGAPSASEDADDEAVKVVRGGASDPQGAGALYSVANEFFEANQQDLVHAGQHIIENYMIALKADPKHAQAPLALYRIGITYIAFENQKRGIKFLEQVVHQWPTHAASVDAWIRLGLLYEAKEAYIEAIEAYRSALRCPIEREKKADVLFYLGKDLSLFGVHKEALEYLGQALNEDPTVYVRHPDVFKFMGESLFAQREYEKSLDYFMRYLNIEGNGQDRDLVLAKIAEIVLTQGDQTLANRLYTYIQNRYQDSEGDAISRIRKAELLEKKGTEGGQVAAYEIYESLHNKKLSAPLRRIVNYRLASWQWRHGKFEKSLGLIEEMFQGKMDPTARDEFTTLRGKVVADWARSSYARNEYALVVSLYEKYPSICEGDAHEEMTVMVAESYGALKLYPTALDLIEGLLAKASPKPRAAEDKAEKAGKKGGKGKKGKDARKEKSDEPDPKAAKYEDWHLKAALYAYGIANSEKALSHLKEVRSDTLDTEKTTVMARLLCEQSKHGDAVKYFQKLLQKEPRLAAVDPDALLEYVKCLVTLGRREEAVAVIQASLGIMPEDKKDVRLQLCMMAGQCQTELRRPEKAIEAMEMALSMNPPEEQRNQLNYEISRLYLAMGQTDKATERLTRLLETSQSFWRTAAEQQLESIRMNGK